MIEVENREALYRAMFEQFSRSDLPALLFDVDEAKQLRARFAESNKRFTARYLGTPLMELGGRRYSDSERAAWRRRIRELDLKC